MSGPSALSAAALTGRASASPARTGTAPDASDTDFARVAADLATAARMEDERPASSDPDPAMRATPLAGGTSPPASRPGARLAVSTDAAIDPAPRAAMTGDAALLPALPHTGDRDALAAAPDDALSQQMFALLSGLAPPTAPAASTPATDAADLLTGLRAPALPPHALPNANTPAGATTDVGPGTGAIDLASLLSELPTMPRANETAAVAAPIAAATAAQIALAASQDVEREDAGAIDGLESLPPGVPLAVHGAIRGPSVPSTVMPPLQMPADPEAGFDDALGARVAWAAEQKLGHAEIRLNPEHLGRIDLKIQLDGTRVSAEFASANADVRQALEATLPKLREMLGQHGLQLGHADVGQRQQNAPQSQGRTAPAFGSGFGDEGASANVAASTPAPVVRSRGLLDEYA